MILLFILLLELLAKRPEIALLLIIEMAAEFAILTWWEQRKDQKGDKVSEQWRKDSRYQREGDQL